MKTQNSIATTTNPNMLAGRLKIACTARLSTLLLLLVLPAAVQAQYNCTINNGTITINKYTGSGGDVTIPDTIIDLPVTSIGFDAFYGCSSLTSVMIGNIVTNIGNYAFEYCSSLTSVTIGTNVTSIGFDAFRFCTSLSSITIGDSVSSIGDDAFAQCFNLTNVMISDSVTSIGNGVFEYCTSLTCVTIGNSVTNIGDETFYGCSGLTSVMIPDSVTSIGNGVFEYCSSLTAITVDTNNPAYSSVEGVLFNQSQTTLIQYPAGKAGSYNIPNSVTSIGYEAFYGCSGLTSVMIGNSVTNIGGWAFNYCTSLTGVYFQGNAPSVPPIAGSDVFFGDNSVTVYYLPGTANWSVAFGGAPTAPWPFPGFLYMYNNGTITITIYTGSGGDVTIPDTINGLPVSSIGGYAFFDCTSLTSIMSGTNVTNIGDGAFSDCTSLSSVTIGNGITSIGEAAFCNCTSLTNVTIPNSVTSIGEAAFDSCTSLSSVTIGNSVTNIGHAAFIDCNSLTNVYFKGNAPIADLYVFYGDNNAVVYYLPGTMGWGSTFASQQTAQWFLPNPLILNTGPNFGVQTNRFGFIISWATNISVVVEACTNLANSTWSPLRTNTLTSGSAYFSDPQWTNYPGRFYRIRSP